MFGVLQDAGNHRADPLLITRTAVLPTLFRAIRRDVDNPPLVANDNECGRSASRRNAVFPCTLRNEGVLPRRALMIPDSESRLVKIGHEDASYAPGLGSNFLPDPGTDGCGSYVDPRGKLAELSGVWQPHSYDCRCDVARSDARCGCCLPEMWWGLAVYSAPIAGVRAAHHSQAASRSATQTLRRGREPASGF